MATGWVSFLYVSTPACSTLCRHMDFVVFYVFIFYFTAIVREVIALNVVCLKRWKQELLLVILLIPLALENQNFLKYEYCRVSTLSWTCQLPSAASAMMESVALARQCGVGKKLRWRHSTDLHSVHTGKGRQVGQTLPEYTSTPFRIPHVVSSTSSLSHIGFSCKCLSLLVYSKHAGLLAAWNAFSQTDYSYFFFFLFCIPSHISGLHYFWWDFWAWDYF